VARRSKPSEIHRLAGRICAARHDRIAYYCDTCPLCRAAKLLEEAIATVDRVVADCESKTQQLIQVRTAYSAIAGRRILET
jgi:hypothetical protein